MEKDFDSIYGEIHDSEIFNLKNPLRKYIILFCVMLCITFIYLIMFFKFSGIEFLGIVVLLCWLAFLFEFIKSKNNYVKLYKEKVVKTVVKKYKENFNYDEKGNVNLDYYKDSEFNDKIFSVKSTDGIYGSINGDAYLNSSYIYTKVKNDVLIDGKRKTEIQDGFYGFFGMVLVKKSINANITIKSNDFKRTYDKKRIEFESAEFEKKFDCFSDNKIVAMQILTLDCIEKINKLYSEIKKPLEICIKNDKIYFRILMKNIFDPSQIGKVVEREKLLKIYNVINFSSELGKSIAENVMDI